MADASEPEGRRAAQALAVEDVLEEIGAGELPRILVLNKIDQVDVAERVRLANRHPDALRSPPSPARGWTRSPRAWPTPRGRGSRASRSWSPTPGGALISAIYAVGREVEQEPGERGTLVRALLPGPEAARIRAALDGDGSAPPSP